MENIFPKVLVDLILMSMTYTFINMSLIQKIKTLSFIKTDTQVWIINLVLSFTLGIPFGIYFYHTTLFEGFWIGLFTFIGAPTLYEILKNQNIINYTPKSLNSTINISSENEIKVENE